MVMITRRRYSRIWNGDVLAIQFSDPKEELVFDLICKVRSIPFLDLVTRSGIEERNLQRILERLEKQQLVKISGRENVVNEFVTVREPIAISTTA